MSFSKDITKKIKYRCLSGKSQILSLHDSNENWCDNKLYPVKIHTHSLSKLGREKLSTDTNLNSY